MPQRIAIQCTAGGVAGDFGESGPNKPYIQPEMPTYNAMRVTTLMAYTHFA